MGGLRYASEKAVVEQILRRRPDVVAVEANPVAHTATVTFDPAETTVDDLRAWVEECGYHCAGPSAPGHIRDPLVVDDHGLHDHAAAERADEAHGHGHGGLSGSYSSLALPIAAGVFQPLGFVLRPEVGAVSMSGSSIIVPLNAVALA